MRENIIMCFRNIERYYREYSCKNYPIELKIKLNYFHLENINIIYIPVDPTLASISNIHEPVGFSPHDCKLIKFQFLKPISLVSTFRLCFNLKKSLYKITKIFN